MRHPGRSPMIRWSAKKLMQRSALALTLLLILGSSQFPSMRAADPSNVELDRQFNKTVKPFLDRYCIGCHGGSAPAAMFDLRSYTSMSTVVNDFGHWSL